MPSRKRQPTNEGQPSPRRRRRSAAASSGTDPAAHLNPADDPWATPPTPPPPLPPETEELRFAEANSTPAAGRLASEIPPEPVRWLVPGIIPAACLTLIVGDPSVGKSTFGAWLCAQSRRPAILPGYEETVGTAVLPRLLANLVPLETCLVLDGRAWAMPADRLALTLALRHHRADLLWIDPIDSYVGEINENDGPAVRVALEAFCRVAKDSGCGIVAARHPGKAPGNFCPGSRQWRAVPRVILQLHVSEGPPLRRFVRGVKAYAGELMKPREYTLLGEPDEPRRWRMGPELDAGEEDVLRVADPVDRWKVDQATALLKHLLSAGEQESAWIYQQAERERLGDRLVRTAARRLGIIVRREGTGKEHRSHWRLPHSGTPAETQRDTPPDRTAETGGGVSVTDPESQVTADSKPHANGREHAPPPPG